MALNALIDTKYLQDLKLFTAVLEKFAARWRAANTLEARLLLEAEALDTYQRLQEWDLKLGLVNVFENPVIENFRDAYNDWETLLRGTHAKLTAISATFLRLLNSQKISMGEIEGKHKSVRQKASALALWDNKAKKIISNHFSDVNGVASNFTTLEMMNVDTEQGAVTLPILSQVEVRPSSIKIGPESNGVAGNSDVTVDDSTADPKVLISNDDNKWFEYERLDGGPCKLNLILELSKSQIINQITIEAAPIEHGLAFEIEDISFSTPGADSVSIAALTTARTISNINTNFTKQQTQTTSTLSRFIVSFVPIEATAMSIRFVQKHKYAVDIASIDLDGNISSSLRNRFAIGLNHISLYSIQYKSSGGINSTFSSLPMGLYAIEPITHVSPILNAQSIDLSYSIDSGSSWIGAITDSQPSTGVLDGIAHPFGWRLEVRRDDSYLNTLTNLYDTEVSSAPEHQLDSISRYQSPSTLRLHSAPKSVDNIYIYQPKICRRGDPFDAITIGQGFGTSIQLPLPVSVTEGILTNLVDSSTVHVNVNGNEYAQVDHSTTAPVGAFRLSDDYTKVIFDDVVPDGQSIGLYLDYETPIFVEKSDGFVFSPRLPFDPDVNTIKIDYLPAKSSRISFVLPKNKNVISLGNSMLVADSIVLTSTKGNAYRRVNSLMEVYDGVDFDYYVDTSNGVLYLAQMVKADSVQISFRAFSKQTVPSTAVEVLYDGAVPSTVKVTKDVFNATAITERIGDGLMPVPQMDTGAVEARSEIVESTSTSRQLSYTNPIQNSVVVSSDLFLTGTAPQEIEFLDGHSEFLGLVHVSDEAIPNGSADSDGVVEFALSARGLWYPGFEVVFEVLPPSFVSNTAFVHKVSSEAHVRSGSVGTYYVGTDGFGYAQIGSGSLGDGYSMSYYWRDPSFVPTDKYSIDYTLGVLYTYADMSNDATITYKASSYRLAYDVVSPINAFIFEPVGNTISVPTEYFSSINSLVKSAWVKAPSPTAGTRFTNYFTPIISLIGFRLS